MRSVNGYLCVNCADEALAKRGIDPRRPSAVDAVDAARRTPELGVNRPENSGDPGRKLDFYA